MTAPAPGQRRQPGVVHRWLTARPVAVDVCLAGVYAAFLLTAAVAGLVLGELGAGAAALRVLMVVSTAVAILARRRAPWAPLVLACASSLVLPVAIEHDDAIALVIAVYTVAAHVSLRAGALAYAAAVVSTAVGTLVAEVSGRGFTEDGDVTLLLLVVAVALLLPLGAGAVRGRRRRYMEELVARAERLAAERDARAREAAVAERERIAREMHDVVAHSLTVVVTLADGAARTEDRESGRQAMRAVAETGRRALDEMRLMLGVLGTGPEASPLSPPPSLDALDSLVEPVRAVVASVGCEVRGEVPDDPSLHLAIHRVVQEAVTNVLRHAVAPGSVNVLVAAESGVVRVLVEDDGRTHSDAPPGAPGSGRGLAGMRERASVLGGTVSAGPAPGRGWRVEAVLPVPARFLSGTGAV
ncbi:sensor histidine kinase [Nocardiopsis halotolerans]|uniref:sensor histidine kinase n=1 Tax=Nocardiopsis halotolerans TaxID=124252 RepID=UPI00034BAC80|nr:histidine kinase [Nocardiopsis halotolerans]